MRLPPKLLKTLFLFSTAWPGREPGETARGLAAKAGLPSAKRSQDSDTRIGEEFGSPREEARPADWRQSGKEGDMGIEILAVAAAILAAIWIIVLWGARYFGPQ